MRYRATCYQASGTKSPDKGSYLRCKKDSRVAASQWIQPQRQRVHGRADRHARLVARPVQQLGGRGHRRQVQRSHFTNQRIGTVYCSAGKMEQLAEPHADGTARIVGGGIWANPAPYGKPPKKFGFPDGELSIAITFFTDCLKEYAGDKVYT